MLAAAQSLPNVYPLASEWVFNAFQFLLYLPDCRMHIAILFYESFAEVLLQLANHTMVNGNLIPYGVRYVHVRCFEYSTRILVRPFYVAL